MDTFISFIRRSKIARVISEHIYVYKSDIESKNMNVIEIET